MDKILYYILGAVFIIISSVLYTIERFIAYYLWIGQMSANTGSYPTNPDLPGLFTNIFIPIFIIIGVILFVLGVKQKNNNINL